MVSNNFYVKTPVFEGPLDALLFLIEKRKLLVNDISIAKVADDFIDYVKSLESFPIKITAHFILVASTLLLIKSRSLLPNIQLTTEEEESIEDLEVRLNILNKYREYSLIIKSMYGISPIYESLQGIKRPSVFAPGKKTTIETIYQSINTVILSFPKEEKIPRAVVKKVISLEEMIEKLTERMQKDLKISFSDFTKQNRKNDEAGIREKIIVSKQEKINIIIGFLAMLELVRRGVIRVNQDVGGSIEMENESIGIPIYE